MVRIFREKKCVSGAFFFVPVLVFVFFTGFMGDLFIANALAQPQDKPAQQEDAAGIELDEASVKAGVAERIRLTRGAQDERFKKFTPDLVTIDGQIPVNIQGMTFFAVKVKILPPPPGEGEETITLVLDKSGTIQIVDIQELASGKSLTQDALNQFIRVEDITADFGKEIFTGKGNHSLIVISDPFCPYCRKGWDYVKARKEKLKSLRLAHFPLNRSAEVTSMVMADANQRKFKLFEVVDFAYTHLNPVNNPEDILMQFMDAFPEFREFWGEDPSIAITKLEENYLEMVREERANAQSLGINSTPFFVVKGQFVKGFNAEKLDKLMP